MKHVLLSLIVFGLAVSASQSQQPAALKIQTKKKLSWNPAAAQKYLDGRAKWWLDWPSSTRGQGTACISCHTALPFALARPALGNHLGESAAGDLENALIANVKKRVANWDKIVAETTADKDPFRPFYAGQRKPSSLGTESVLNALVLVNHDTRRAKGVLSESTRMAFVHLDAQQRSDGAWLWLDFGLKPWEADAAYYGASLAALAVGKAGRSYYAQGDLKPKVAALSKYLTTQYGSQPLHHRMVALWASSRLPGILSEQDKEKLVEEILSIQEADGGWSLAKLGRTSQGKGKWQAQGASQHGVVSDGYATGLAILSLKSTGLPADTTHMKKGIGWLVANQKDGAWPAIHLNKARDPATDTGKFMQDAATAFAVLALTESD